MILVTGATGVLGSALTPHLLEAGADVHGLSRRPRPAEGGVTWHQGDLRTGDGIDAAVTGAGTIVHCATDPRRPKGDLPAARALVETLRRHGTPHLVHISIVGVDRHPFGYYRTKHAVERVIEDSGLPYTILRATQFHDLMAQVLGALARVPGAMPVPRGISDQPIDAAEVAARLAELALGEPAGRAEDMGGPETLTLDEMARAFLRATGRRRAVLPVPLPGRSAAGFRNGLHLAPGHAVGKRTWAQYLAARYQPE